MTATAATPPRDIGDARAELAELFLQGNGLEIGALHLPTALPLGSQARYVDRMSVVDLRAHYPELSGLDLTPVDVIDDGEQLATVDSASVDFIVANHFLEHCQDPIGTIQTHLSKLRPGGALFYAVPDKRYTFDFRRPSTTLQHVIDDHERGPERSRAGHYLEWAQLIYGDEPPTEEQARTAAEQLAADDYSIHFHVWTQADLTALMFHIHERLGSFEVEAIRRRGIENIVVLRKLWDAESEPAGDGTVDPVNVWTDLPARSRTAIPLAGLRARLDEGSAAAHWSLEPDGLLGRAWVLSTEAPVTLPLVLDGPVLLKARAQLLPHDWRDGTGGVDAWAAVQYADRRRQTVWASTLTPATDPAGVAIEALIAADVVELRFGISKRGVLTDRSIARLALLDPYLSDPRSDAPGELDQSPLEPQTPARVPADGPVVSILCPVHDPPLYMLDEAIGSVRAQTYRNWELVLCDDGSTSPEVVAMLDRQAAKDPRITLTRRAEAGGISVATSTALAAATGEYVGMLDHDDTLHPDALAHVVQLLGSDPSIDMVYSDEGVLVDGKLTALHLKPDWSPELMQVAMYTNHLAVYRRSLAVELGGFSADYPGTQDYHFVLRLCERTGRIAHIPEILYRWRAHASSTAGGAQSKPYAYTAQPAVISAHLKRQGIDAEVQHGPAPGLHRIVHRVDAALGVTIVLAVDQVAALREAAISWMSQSHANWRVIMSAPLDQLDDAVHTLHHAGIPSTRITALATDPAHGVAAALDTGARLAVTDQLVLMSAPLLGLSRDWLSRLVGYSSQDGVAAAGPVILSEDGRIADAGLAVPGPIPVPLVHGLVGAAAPAAAMDVTALDGALTTSRATYQEIGGIDSDAGALGLVDFCMRAADRRGWRSVLVPDVRMRVIGPDRATNDLPRLWELGRRFARGHSRDPYYNPRYRSDRADFHLRRDPVAEPL
jgi:GT2 family glycosyltransferase/SAM-dependent methyltransferase